MAKKKIIRMKESDDDTKGYLAYEDSDFPKDSEYFLIFKKPNILDENPDPKSFGLEELAQMCDLNAESRNDHDYVGAHRLLAALLFTKVGREKATEIMLEIAEYGGLDYMVGMDGQKPVYEEFGIKKPWHEWNLPME